MGQCYVPEDASEQMYLFSSLRDTEAIVLNVLIWAKIVSINNILIKHLQEKEIWL